MKIRRFNESLRFPTEVSESEFFKKKSIHKMVDFSASERKQIIDILNKKNKRFSLSSEYVEIHSDLSPEVVKFDDEWFTIIQYKYYNNGGTYSFFICDGFEEVLSYLNEL